MVSWSVGRSLTAAAAAAVDPVQPSRFEII